MSIEVSKDCNAGSIASPATKKGFKQPKTKCENCGNEYSNGNFRKHRLACLGKGKKKTHLCEVCSESFESYGQPKTCSVACRHKYLKVRVADQYKHGERLPVGYTKKTCYYESKTHGRLKLMSSYEKDACKILDEWMCSGKIKYWEYTDDRFSYFDSDGKLRTYFPDFKVFSNTVYYIETKGFETDLDAYKWQAVRDQGFELLVWFGDTIEEYKDNKD